MCGTVVEIPHPLIDGGEWDAGRFKRAAQAAGAALLWSCCAKALTPHDADVELKMVPVAELMTLEDSGPQTHLARLRLRRANLDCIIDEALQLICADVSIATLPFSAASIKSARTMPIEVRDRLRARAQVRTDTRRAKCRQYRRCTLFLKESFHATSIAARRVTCII